MLNGKDHLEDLGISGRYWKYVLINEMGCEMNSADSEYSSVVGFYEHYDEPSNSIKTGIFLANWATVSISRSTVLYEATRSAQGNEHS